MPVACMQLAQERTQQLWEQGQLLKNTWSVGQVTQSSPSCELQRTWAGDYNQNLHQHTVRNRGQYGAEGLGVLKLKPVFSETHPSELIVPRVNDPFSPHSTHPEGGTAGNHTCISTVNCLQKHRGRNVMQSQALMKLEVHTVFLTNGNPTSVLKCSANKGLAIYLTSSQAVCALVGQLFHQNILIFSQNRIPCDVIFFSRSCSMEPVENKFVSPSTWLPFTRLKIAIRSLFFSSSWGGRFPVLLRVQGLQSSPLLDKSSGTICCSELTAWLPTSFLPCLQPI